MKSTILTGLLAMSVLTAAVVAQQSTAGPAPATRAQILKFMELTHVKAGVSQMFEGMKMQARIGAEQAFKQKVPHATPARLEKVDAIADEMFTGFPIDELLEAIVPIYQKHLSKTDLDAVIAFYSSPAGQKFVKESPAMMSEAMQAGGEIGRKRMDEINQRIEQRIEDLAREMSQPAPEGKTPEPK